MKHVTVRVFELYSPRLTSFSNANHLQSFPLLASDVYFRSLHTSFTYSLRRHSCIVLPLVSVSSRSGFTSTRFRLLRFVFDIIQFVSFTTHSRLSAGDQRRSFTIRLRLVKKLLQRQQFHCAFRTRAKRHPVAACSWFTLS